MMEAKPLSESSAPRRQRLDVLLSSTFLHLVRRPLDPGDLEKGDRLRIDSGTWQVRGRLLLVSGSWAFLLEPAAGLPPGTRTARLLSPSSAEEEAWTFFYDGRTTHLGPERIVRLGAAV